MKKIFDDIIQKKGILIKGSNKTVVTKYEAKQIIEVLGELPKSYEISKFMLSIKEK